MGGVVTLLSAIHFNNYLNNEGIDISSETFTSLERAQSFIREWGREMPDAAFSYSRKSLAPALENKALVGRVPMISELEREIANIQQQKIDVNNPAAHRPLVDSVDDKLTGLIQLISHESNHVGYNDLSMGIFNSIMAACLLISSYLVKKRILFRDRAY